MIQLLQRLKQEGPVQIVLGETDYQTLCSETKRIWRYTDSRRRWSPDDRLIVLGFLAGYSFYREIDLNERHFWNGFNSELGLAPEAPSSNQYDQLWQAFNHPEIDRYRVIKSGDRYFVATIERVWGLNRLKSDDLIQVFLEFYRSKSGQISHEQAILLTGGHPERSDQVKSYSQIFQGLRLAVATILENEIDIRDQDPESALELLGEELVRFGEPNPVRYLMYKSPKALEEIVARLGGPHRRLRPRSKASTSQRTDIAPGPTHPNLTIVHQMEPALIIENQVYYGEAVNSAGVSQAFKWSARRSPKGEKLPVTIEFELAGQSHHFSFIPASLAVRAFQDGQVVSAITTLNPERLELRVFNPYQREFNLRYRVTSQPDDQVSQLAALRPQAQDQLLIEAEVNRRTKKWSKLALIPLELTPQILATTRQDGVLEVEVAGAGELELKVSVASSQGQSQSQFAVQSGTNRCPLPLPRLLQAQVSLELKSGGKVYDRHELCHKPELDLSRLRVGLGFGELVNRSRGVATN